MRLARITGRVWASVKSGGLVGRKMLLADYVGPDGGVLEPAAVVTDACGAGPGDLVLVAAGSAARIPPETAGVPTDATAVAVVDATSVQKPGADPGRPDPGRRESKQAEPDEPPRRRRPARGGPDRAARAAKPRVTR